MRKSSVSSDGSRSSESTPTILFWHRKLLPSGFRHAIRQLADDYVYEMYGALPMDSTYGVQCVCVHVCRLDVYGCMDRRICGCRWNVLLYIFLLVC